MDANTNAHRFAAAYPHLAAAIDDATTPEHITRARRAARKQAARGVLAIVAVFLLLLAGRLWWDWGTWSAVALGVVGALVAGGLIELATYRHAPVVVIADEEGQRR